MAPLRASAGRHGSHAEGVERHLSARAKQRRICGKPGGRRFRPTFACAGVSAVTMLDAMHDPQLFGPWFQDRASWRLWEVFLAALFGLPLHAMGTPWRCSRSTAAAPRHPLEAV